MRAPAELRCLAGKGEVHVQFTEMEFMDENVWFFNGGDFEDEA